MRPSQYHLSAWQDSGANPPGKYAEGYGGQGSDW